MKKISIIPLKKKEEVIEDAIKPFSPIGQMNNPFNGVSKNNFWGDVYSSNKSKADNTVVEDL